MADDFENLLRAWGVAYAERPVNIVDPVTSFERRSRSHALAIVQQFAPGKRPKRLLTSLKDSGIARRERMGRAAEMQTLGGRPMILPRWACDPIPARETRSRRRADRTVHPALGRIDGWVRELEQRHLLRGLCLRVRYCVPGSRAEQAQEVSARLRQSSPHHPGINAGQFRDYTHHAREWLAGKLLDALDGT